MQPESIPDLFKCPICCEILRLPHTSLCGHTCCLCCWMKLSGDKPKVDYILGTIASFAVACPVCRRIAPIGSNHSLRSHIEENYTKETTKRLYEDAVDVLTSQIRETVTQEIREMLLKEQQDEHERFATVVTGVPEIEHVRLYPSRQRHTMTKIRDRIMYYFWKFIGFNIVMSAILVPVAAIIVIIRNIL